MATAFGWVLVVAATAAAIVPVAAGVLLQHHRLTLEPVPASQD